jgi:hypothetical protein
MRLTPNSPEFWVALGAFGLDGVLDEPFVPFVVEFDDGEEVAYRILDPRAIEIYVDHIGYTIGLAINEMKGVKDMYRVSAIRQITREIEVTSPRSDTWYSWGRIE